MSYYDTHAAAMQATQNLLGEACPTFQWQGSDWKIVPDSVSLEKNLRQGGFTFDTPNILAFHALALQFGDSEPEPQQEMTYLGREYQIDTKQILPGGLIIRYVCSDKHRGAGGS